MKKYIYAVFIIAIFFITAILVLKIPQPNSTSEFNDVPVDIQSSSEEWLGVYLQGQRIGYSFTKTSKTKQGLIIENKTQMTLIMMTERRSLATHLYARTDTAYTLDAFSVNIVTAGHETKVEGSIQGTTLALTSYSQGTSQTQTIKLKEKPFFPDAIEELIRKKQMKPGDEITIPYFDPTTQSSTSARISMGEKEHVAVLNKDFIGSRVEITAMGITSILWIDEEFKLIKESSPAMGLELIPLTREDALADIEEQDAFDLLSFFAVKLSEPLPKPTTLSYLKLRLQNISYEDLDISDDYQRLRSTNPIVLEFHTPDLSTIKNMTIPVQGHDDYLQPTVYIQCQSPEILAKAHDMIGDEKDAATVVSRLVTGVYNYIEKNPTASLPSAIDVLKTREGDCTEHSVLFAALARAVGIPTKIYVGLVNLQGSAYYYHAWCAVWLGTWIPVDPTFNQFPADLGHLKLKEGGLAEWAKVMQVVGQLDITVMEYKTDGEQ